jgi:hypothetical protein
VHLSPVDGISRITVKDGTPRVALGPTERRELWINVALRTATWLYGQLADLAIERLGITDLAQWREHFQRLMSTASQP